MQALIDADLVAFINAASAEGEDEWIALARVDTHMQSILDTVGADSYRAFLSGQDNFRYEVNPQYKANRKDVPQPRHRDACKQHLVVNWKAEITEGYEADDALGIHQAPDTIIWSIDKDLDMIPVCTTVGLFFTEVMLYGKERSMKYQKSKVLDPSIGAFLLVIALTTFLVLMG